MAANNALRTLVVNERILIVLDHEKNRDKTFPWGKVPQSTDWGG